MESSHLSASQRKAILRFDTCKVADAIEKLGIRLKNEGFTQPGLQCRTPGYPRVLGYAVTSRIRGSDPLMRGASSYYDLSDWWSLIETRPYPRIAVMQDLDDCAGLGAGLSDVHAHVLKALGCIAVVTNGSVRNLEALAALEFPAFSCSVSMSHAYVHMVNYGVSVEVLGLTVHPADLLYVDVHGMIQIPTVEVESIIRLLEERTTKETRLISLCDSAQPKLEEVRAVAREL